MRNIEYLFFVMFLLFLKFRQFLALWSCLNFVFFPSVAGFYVTFYLIYWCFGNLSNVMSYLFHHILILTLYNFTKIVSGTKMCFDLLRIYNIKLQLDDDHSAQQVVVNSVVEFTNKIEKYLIDKKTKLNLVTTRIMNSVSHYYVKYVDFADIYFTMFCMALLTVYNKVKAFILLYKNMKTKWLGATFNTNKITNNDAIDDTHGDTNNVTNNIMNDISHESNLYNESNKHLKDLERILENTIADLD